MMIIDYMIRKLTAEETDIALTLVWKAFQQFKAPDYTEATAVEFRKSVLNEDYLKQLDFYGAFDAEKLIGMLAVRRGGNHIALFFVDGDYQRQGIGSALFIAAFADCTEDKITVNSSPYTVPIYHALGFRDTDSEQEQSGIRYTPMEYILHDSSCPCKRTKCERYGDCRACRNHHKTVKGTPVSCDRIKSNTMIKAERLKRRKTK